MGDRPFPNLRRLIHLAHPSIWGQFVYSPTVYLARVLYSLRRKLPHNSVSNPVSVVCISDTHNTQPQVPYGDILIHAGDLTQAGTFAELQETLDWLNSLPHEHKVIVAGNHDKILDDCFLNLKLGIGEDELPRSLLNWGDVIYLENESTEVTCANGRSINIYGSPQSPQHGSPAFQYPRSTDVWSNTVPANIDILITHSPPRAHLDLISFGCVYLLHELWRVKPKLHVFGHVHEAHGLQWIQFDTLQKSYESIVMNNGGIGLLYRMIEELIQTWFGSPKDSRCALVNASSVGGLLGKKNAPIKVVI